MKYCHTKDDVPKNRHYAIITFGSIHIPGDERSRTNPGHGYPAHDEHTAQYQAFDNQTEWESEINKIARANTTSHHKEDFVALVVDPAIVTTQVVIKTAVVQLNEAL